MAFSGGKMRRIMQHTQQFPNMGIVRRVPGSNAAKLRVRPKVV
jgi:hypothetical protein